MAVHDGVDPPVDEAEAGLEAGDPEGTGVVVPSATLVRGGEAPYVRILGGAPPLPAPLRAGHAEEVAQVSSYPDKRRTRIKLQSLEHDIRFLAAVLPRF